MGGADTIEGGAGSDTASYKSSDAGVAVNLATGTASGGHAEGDTLSGIENLDGSNGADRLTGDSGANILRGLGGADTFEGGAGADTIEGGTGTDTASYISSDAGVSVNLATETASGGHAEGDTLSGIENLDGSNHADQITGDDGANILRGLGGADTIEGGAGMDTASYISSDAGVTVNLAIGAASGGHAEGDTLSGIENLDGSNHADQITGDASANALRGFDGDDTIEGGARSRHDCRRHRNGYRFLQIVRYRGHC